MAALPAGTQGMAVVCALGLAAASVLTVWMGRRLVWRPRDVHERLIGVTLILTVLSSLLRASYLWTWRRALRVATVTSAEVQGRSVP